MVHDVLGMQSNSLTIEEKGGPGVLPGAPTKKRYEVRLANCWDLFLLSQSSLSQSSYALQAVPFLQHVKLSTATALFTQHPNLSLFIIPLCSCSVN